MEVWPALLNMADQAEPGYCKSVQCMPQRDLSRNGAVRSRSANELAETALVALCTQVAQDPVLCLPTQLACGHN